MSKPRRIEDCDRSAAETRDSVTEPQDDDADTDFRYGKGVIRRCARCGQFELEYGNFGVTLDVRGLLRFRELAHEGLLGAGRDWRSGDVLHLKLSDGGFRLVIPCEEIKDLWLLLRDGIGCLMSPSCASTSQPPSRWLH